MFPQLVKKETKESKRGKEFTTANGGKIKNEGEKLVPYCTLDGEKKRVRAQLAKVTRVLISASKMTKAGYKISLDADNPSIKNIKTGKVTKLRHKNGIFIIDMWVDTEASQLRARCLH